MGKRIQKLMLKDLAKKTLYLGYASENIHTQIVIDCSEVFWDYPNATYSMNIQPPRGDKYPAAQLAKDGDALVWTVTDSDLIYHGSGHIQLEFKNGDEVIKSAVGTTKIDGSIETTGDVPTPLEDWMDQAEETAHQIALTAKDEVIEQIQDAAEEARESIPADYTQLSDDVSSLKSAFDETNKIDELTIKNITGNMPVIGWKYKYYYPTSSSATNVNVDNPMGSPALKCAFIPCVPGDVFYYTGKGTSSARSWAFLKSNGDIISKASAGEYASQKITAPALSAYVVFNCEIDHDVCVYKNLVLVERVDTLEAEMQTANTLIDNMTSEANVTGTGELFQTKITEIRSLETTATSISVRNAQLYEQKYSGGSINGVTFTNNGDGSYTINGTATGSTWFFINQSTRTGSDNYLSLHGVYSISIETLAGSASALSVALRQYPEDINSLTATLSNPKIYGTVDSDHIVIGVYVSRDSVYTGYKFRVMVNKGTEALPYVDYIAPTVVTDMTTLLTTAKQYIPDLWMIADEQTESITGAFTIISGLSSESSENNRANVICANHRGYHAGFPENTLWAFAQSKLRGFEWIENDVRFTSDGVGVLLHDESINRTARNADGTEISETVNIADITYAQAREYDFGIYAGSKFAGTKIVTVEECVAFCKAVGLGIFMEPKVNGSGTYCANIVKSYAMEDNVIWISFGLTPLQEVNAVLPNAKVGLVTTQQPSSSHVTNAVSLKTQNNSVFLDFNYQYSISDIKSSMISNDIGYGVYTLDSIEALETLDPYCFAITSNALLASKVIANNEMKKWS